MFSNKCECAFEKNIYIKKPNMKIKNKIRNEKLNLKKN